MMSIVIFPFSEFCQYLDKAEEISPDVEVTKHPALCPGQRCAQRETSGSEHPDIDIVTGTSVISGLSVVIIVTIRVTRVSRPHSGRDVSPCC